MSGGLSVSCAAVEDAEAVVVGVCVGESLAFDGFDDAVDAFGGPGSGPAGVAAAYWLGLTSQVPSTYLAAVPTRVPTPWPGMRFTQRPVGRLLRALTPSEVAVLEVLRAGPAVVEAAWEELPTVITGLAASGAVRLTVLDEAAAEEPHRQARSRWAELRARPELTPSGDSLAARLA